MLRRGRKVREKTGRKNYVLKKEHACRERGVGGKKCGDCREPRDSKYKAALGGRVVSVKGILSEILFTRRGEHESARGISKKKQQEFLDIGTEESLVTIFFRGESEV